MMLERSVMSEARLSLLECFKCLSASKTLLECSSALILQSSSPPVYNFVALLFLHICVKTNMLPVIIISFVALLLVLLLTYTINKEHFDEPPVCPEGTILFNLSTGCKCVSMPHPVNPSDPSGPI